MTRRGDGPLPHRLQVLHEQLWHGVAEDVRFATGRPAAGWRSVESYWVFPDAARARLLLPADGPAATTGAVANYRRLRPPAGSAVRAALGAAARAGAPLGTTRLRVLVPSERPAAAESLPLRVVAGALGGGLLRAAVGVRDQANGKATLQLVRPDGGPAGYAKLGWNGTTDRYVATEAAALTEVGGSSGSVRAPRVLARCDYAGHPVVVTEPLPPDVRAVRGRVRRPSPTEVHDLAPVVRRARPAATAHLAALRARLDRLTAPHVRETAGLARRLLDRVGDVAEALPVGSRWHGDLAPWNCARDAAGTLWVWDWEYAEPDALAGLDAVHWAASVHREQGGGRAPDLRAWVEAAQPDLVAVGTPRRHWRTVASVYAATVVERACALAVEDGGWARVWVTPAELSLLAAQATA